jgi:hypothetical protein
VSLELTEILYDALRTPHGVVVETNDPSRLRQKLYAIRREDPDLSPLAFVISPLNGSDLWILNKGTSNAEE